MELKLFNVASTAGEGWSWMAIGVIADQIDNEKRPQLAPGRSGWWEGNLVREELCRPTSICSENREDTWALRGGGP